MTTTRPTNDGDPNATPTPRTTTTTTENPPQNVMRTMRRNWNYKLACPRDNVDRTSTTCYQTRLSFTPSLTGSENSNGEYSTQMRRVNSLRASIVRRIRPSMVHRNRHTGSSSSMPKITNTTLYEADRQAIRISWRALKEADGGSFDVIQRAWLHAATIAPTFVWNAEPVNLPTPRNDEHIVRNDRFDRLIRMVVKFLHNCIVALDLQTPAVTEYIAEQGANHAKYLGTAYTDPAFWDAFQIALIDGVNDANEKFAERALAEGNEMLDCEIRVIYQAWHKFITLLITTMRSAYVAELQHADQRRRNEERRSTLTDDEGEEEMGNLSIGETKSSTLDEEIVREAKTSVASTKSHVLRQQGCSPPQSLVSESTIAKTVVHSPRSVPVRTVNNAAKFCAPPPIENEKLTALKKRHCFVHRLSSEEEMHRSQESNA